MDHPVLEKDDNRASLKGFSLVVRIQPVIRFSRPNTGCNLQPNLKTYIPFSEALYILNTLDLTSPLDALTRVPSRNLLTVTEEARTQDM